MSRAFNGPTTADAITFAVGNAPPDQGPITIAVLAKAANISGFTGWLVQARATSSPVWSELTSNNVGPKLFMENDFTAGNAGLTTGWAWYVVSKAAGASTPRWHIHDLTAATAWSHANAAGTVGDGTGPITNILVGGNLSAANTWRGSIAVVAAWDSVLSDVAIEAAMTSAAADTLAATPKWMVRLNQASTATSVTDDTGGGGNQTALAGTSVDADDPPSYNYALTGLTTVTSDLDARWAVRATVTSDLDARWAVLATVLSDLDTRWGIGGTVVSDLILKWAVLAVAGTQEGASYELEDIMDALAGTFNGVETGDSIRGVAQAITCVAEVPTQVTVPAIVLEIDDLEWDLNMGSGADSFTVLATVLVQFQDVATAQRELWRFLSRRDTSGIGRVKAALQANQDLGGLVSYAHLARIRNIGTVTYNAVDYLGAELIIEVMS